MSHNIITDTRRRKGKEKQAEVNQESRDRHEDDDDDDDNNNDNNNNNPGQTRSVQVVEHDAHSGAFRYIESAREYRVPGGECGSARDGKTVSGGMPPATCFCHHSLSI